LLETEHDSDLSQFSLGDFHFNVLSPLGRRQLAVFPSGGRVFAHWEHQGDAFMALRRRIPTDN
jgi:hypothetical protein